MSREKPEPLTAPGEVWLVGCGNLGRALVSGWLAAGMDPARLTIIEPAPCDLPGEVRITAAPSAALPRPDVIVLAVKPQALALAAPGLAPHADGALLLSVLAGVSLATLRSRFPGARLVRALPSTPARIRRALTLLVAGDAAPDPDRALAATLMRAIGDVVWIAEGDMDAASAVSASGPAFLFRFVEAMAAAGRANGLPPELADRIAMLMVAGSAELLAADGRPPAALREEVTSPAGMTAAGLDVLDGGGALTTLLTETIGAAARRSAEMGREAA